MDVTIKAHNFKLTDGLREYVEKRVAKLDRVNERITEAKFEIREQPHHSPNERFRAQFTIATRKAILRAEDRSEDAHAAIDIVTDKMARQIRRFHDRKIHRSRREAVNLGLLAAEQAVEDVASIALDSDDELEASAIVRTKRFQVLPMDTEEAIEQIELLGHDFFVFYNLDTSQMNVLYRRKGGQFGVLEPELA
jgi:putative sigma-54 modulation protein